MTDNEAEFDEHATTYSRQVEDAIGVGGLKHDFFLQVKADELLRLTREHVGNPAELDVLDVGCGIGEMDALLTGRFNRLCGVDISAKSIEEAKTRVPGVEFSDYDGGALPYEDAAFDAAFASCVMHHVPPAQWEHFLSEMRRVVRPTGIIAIFEHNPLNPLTRRVVSRCEFDKDAVLLGRGRMKQLFRATGLQPLPSPYLLFVPAAGAAWRSLESWLRWCPLGAQYVGVATPAADATPSIPANAEQAISH